VAPVSALGWGAALILFAVMGAWCLGVVSLSEEQRRRQKRWRS